MEQTICHEIFYPHAPEKVWDYLTKPALLEQWLMKNDFLPVVGHDFQFLSRPMPQYQFDGIINCRVLEIVPFQKLVYSWKGGIDGQVTLDSVVTWTLDAREGGTTLLLEHTGFQSEQINMYTIMNEGWLRNMHKINNLLTASGNEHSQS